MLQMRVLAGFEQHLSAKIGQKEWPWGDTGRQLRMDVDVHHLDGEPTPSQPVQSAQAAFESSFLGQNGHFKIYRHAYAVMW